MNKRVAIIKCDDYIPEKVYQSLREAVNLAEDLDLRGKNVLLKPNILFDADPKKAITTHPVFLQAAIRICQEEGASEVYVGDGPAFQKPSYSGRTSGLRQVTDACDAFWVDFTKGTTTLHCPQGRVSRQFIVSEIIHRVDRIISLPKLKTHQLMYYTGAMKNLFGMVPNLLKSPYHLRHPSRGGFATMIIDLNIALNPHYAFMDAVVGMEGPGPGSGYPRELGLILASSNLLALDAVASQIIGYPPLEIPITVEALSRKRWLNSLEEIETLGEDPQKLIIGDYKRITIKKSSSRLKESPWGDLVRHLRKLTEPRPIFMKEPCIQCGDCINICPVKALEFHGRGKSLHVSVDYSLCIRCYCCHEVCPADAIEVKRKIFSRSTR